MAKMIDGEAYKEMILAAAAAVADRVEEVNALNVFPVPDGDTGTNMSMTLNNAADQLHKLENPTLGRALDLQRAASRRPRQLRRHHLSAVPRHCQGHEGRPHR